MKICIYGHRFHVVFLTSLHSCFQISFHIFMDNGISGKDNSGGEVEIEKFDTRVVEVRKRDLVPVLDRFKNYQFDEDLR